MQEIHKPWVFFSSSAFAGKDVSPFLKYWSDFDLYFSSKRTPSLLAQIFPHIQDGHYAARAVPKCISYHEAFSRTAGPRKIYKAIDSVITYLNYHRNGRLQQRTRSGNFSEFYLPVIVLDGFLFEASSSKRGIELHARPHLQLRTYHREDIYVIDVVTKEHFEHFFNEVYQFHKQLVAAIEMLTFPSDLKAAVKAKLKRQWDSPDPWVRDMMLLMSKHLPRRSKTHRKTPKQRNE
jgi:hypothetical protein